MSISLTGHSWADSRAIDKFIKVQGIEWCVAPPPRNVEEQTRNASTLIRFSIFWEL